MTTITSVLAGLGMTAIAGMLVMLALLSWRLGRVTRATTYYRVFFVAMTLVLMGAVARFWVFINPHDAQYDSIAWILVYNGMPAVGLTLGVIVAWHYWSWLLAERD